MMNASNPMATPRPAVNPIDMLRQNPQQAMQLLNEFRQSPAQMLARMGYSIPQNISTPDQIGQYLLSTGQITQQQIQQAQSMSPLLGQLLSK
jgi:hypothetical protein